VIKAIEEHELWFFRRKYNKEGYLIKYGCFGMVERESGELFAQVVDKRCINTFSLNSKIDLNIVEILYLMSNNGLKKLKYNHESINH